MLRQSGKQAVERDRIDHRAGEDMGADLGALLQHHHRDVLALLGGKLLQPDCGSEPSRPGADNDDVELHGLAFGSLSLGRFAQGPAPKRQSFPRQPGITVSINMVLTRGKRQRVSGMTATERHRVQALLAWYAAMGVDEAIGEEPVDCFAAQPLPPSPAAHQDATSPGRDRLRPAGPTRKLASYRRGRQPRRARGLGRRVRRLRAQAHGEESVLRAGTRGRKADADRRSARPRRGSAAASRSSGAPGNCSTACWRRSVSTEKHVYITNTVYWRPPGNRTPTPAEVEACAPFLARQIELLSPEVLVLLGGAAAKTILGVTEGIMRLRGKWLTYSCAGRDIATLATLHPAYLLRTPADKRLAWRDLLMVKERLEAT